MVVKANGVTLTKDTDYTLSYSDNVNAGQVTVTATAEEGYQFENWTINGVEVSIENPYTATISFDKTAFVVYVSLS